MNSGFSLSNIQSLGKRGLSTIVVILLLVMFSIILIGVIWAVINNLVSINSQHVSLDSECLYSHLEITSFQCTSSGNGCNVTVKRTRGDSEISGIRMLFSNGVEDSAYIDFPGNIIVPTNRKIQVINIGVENITKISAAIYFNSSGEIFPCSVTSMELVESVSFGETSEGTLSPPPLPNY